MGIFDKLREKVGSQIGEMIGETLKKSMTPEQLAEVTKEINTVLAQNPTMVEEAKEAYSKSGGDPDFMRMREEKKQRAIKRRMGDKYVTPEVGLANFMTNPLVFNPENSKEAKAARKKEEARQLAEQKRQEVQDNAQFIPPQQEVKVETAPIITPAPVATDIQPLLEQQIQTNMLLRSLMSQNDKHAGDLSEDVKKGMKSNLSVLAAFKGILSKIKGKFEEGRDSSVTKRAAWGVAIGGVLSVLNKDNPDNFYGQAFNALPDGAKSTLGAPVDMMSKLLYGNKDDPEGKKGWKENALPTINMIGGGMQMANAMGISPDIIMGMLAPLLSTSTAVVGATVGTVLGVIGGMTASTLLKVVEVIGSAFMSSSIIKEGMAAAARTIFGVATSTLGLAGAALLASTQPAAAKDELEIERMPPLARQAAIEARFQEGYNNKEIRNNEGIITANPSTFAKPTPTIMERIGNFITPSPSTSAAFNATEQVPKKGSTAYDNYMMRQEAEQRSKARTLEAINSFTPGYGAQQPPMVIQVPTPVPVSGGGGSGTERPAPTVSSAVAGPNPFFNSLTIGITHLPGN